MLISSLRGRLFAGLTIFIVGMALAAGYLAYRWAFDEAIELQDAILLQVGSLAERNHLSTKLPSEGNIDGEAQVLIEEIGPGVGNTASNLPSDLPDGLQTVARGGSRWRMLVRTRADGSRIAVGQPTANRDEIAQDSALRTIVPLGVLIPCLMVLIAIVVNRTLRPLSRLAARLDAKQSDHLERLPTEGIPTELLPFVSSINRLLERIGAMFDSQRRFIAAATGQMTLRIQSCGSLVRPYWISTSFLRRPIATGPATPPLIVKSPLAEQTLPIGEITAAVPQANASFNLPLAASARHWSIV